VQEDAPVYDPEISFKQHNKFRLLLVITRLTVGGDTNVVLDIASHFGKHPDFEASLAVGPVPDGETDLTWLAYEQAIPTIVIPSLVNRINPVQNLAAVRQLRSIMVRGQYDIVHTHSSVAGIVGRTAALSARIPVIVHHVHGWGLREDMSPGLRVVYLTLERLCARFTSRMIAVSEPTIQKGLGYHICPKEKFALIYNGIHLQTFSQQVDRECVLQDLGLDPECKIVGMIGRLDKQKNPLDFIRTAAIVVKDYPKVQFLIAGDGGLRTDCERLIRELGLEGKFFLLGFRDDIHRILPAVNIVVLSSLWEGLPVVFQEAMSAGKPIVANNVDGACDVVVDGETGYLVTPHRPQEMADRILYLLNNDELSNRFGLTAQRNSKIFSSEQMTEKIEALYRELLATQIRHGTAPTYSPPATRKRPI
jgi:glycosyltransferase involved in cell wall biosynthesis